MLVITKAQLLVLSTSTTHKQKYKCRNVNAVSRERRCKLPKEDTWCNVVRSDTKSSLRPRRPVTKTSLSKTSCLFRSPSCARHQGSRQVKAKRHQVTKTRPPPPSLSVTTECSSPSSELLHQEWGLRSPHKCRATPHQVGGSSGDHQDACRNKTSIHKVALSRTNLYKL